MTSETINLLTIIISILAFGLSIASFVVAFLTYKSDRFKILIRYIKTVVILTNGEFVDGICIIVSNKGKRPITIESIYFETKNSLKLFLSQIQEDCFSKIGEGEDVPHRDQLPVRLNEGQSGKWNLPRQVFIDTINNTGGEDAFRYVGCYDQIGNDYKKKIIENHFRWFRDKTT